MDTTPLEFSANGEFAVHSSHDGVIKVWESATNSLKSEYKPSSHLSATCTCLSWCPRARELMSGKKKKRKKSRGSVANAIEELDLVAIGTASGSILLYSVVKGDLHSQLVEGHSDRVNSVIWYPESDILLSCSSDHHIVEWEVTSSKVRHKWKGDKGPVHSLCKCSSKHFLSAGRSIKLWDLETKQELKRFTGHATEVFKLLHVPTSTETSVDNSYFLSAAVNDRVVNAWQINPSSQDRNALAAFSLPDEPVDMNISSRQAERPLILVVVTKCGKALLFEHKLNGKLKKPLTPKLTIQIASSGDKASIPRPIQILAAYVCDEDEHKLLLVHGNHLRPTFEKVSCSTSESEMCLIRENTMALKAKRDQNISKVKTPEISKDMTVLVPGQMAPLPPAQEGRRKRKASVGEMTLEQRLNAVSLEKPKSGGGNQPPKADTVVTLLMQGLQSQDKTLLNQVLQKTDAKLIKNTVKKLPVQMVIPLVQELTRRMHGHAQMGVPQVVWIQTVLAVHTAYLMSFPEIIETFSTLYQMMDSRVTMLSKLSRLKGKLDIMLSQISAQAQAEDKGLEQTPLLQFEEESSDEDFDELAIGPGASDSESNWEDLSSEGSDMEVQEEVNGKG